MKQFWPLSHENYPAKIDQLKIFDDQKIQNAFYTSFSVLTPRITFLRTKIWTFQISSTAKMSKFEKLFRKGQFDNKLPEDGIKLLNQLTGKLLGTLKNGIKKVFAISYNRVVNLETLFVYINKHLFKYIGKFLKTIKW